MTISNELRLLRELSKDIYYPNDLKPLNNDELASLIASVEPSRVLTVAEKNRMHFHLSESDRYLETVNDPICLKRIEAIQKFKADFNEAIKATYDDFNKYLGDDYLVLKTYRGFSRWSHDVDILVRDKAKAVERLVKNGWFLEPTDQGPFKSLLSRDGRIITSVHERVWWNKVEVMENELSWHNTQTVNFEGINLRLPSINSEFLTLLGHIPYELLYFRLDDLLYMYKIDNEVDWDVVADQAQRLKWPRTYDNALALYKETHKFLYNETTVGDPDRETIYKKEITLPYLLPVWEICKAHIEVNAWHKVWSARFIVKDGLARFFNKFEY